MACNECGHTSAKQLRARVTGPDCSRVEKQGVRLAVQEAAPGHDTEVLNAAIVLPDGGGRSSTRFLLKDPREARRARVRAIRVPHVNGCIRKQHGRSYM
jgi:hypothetical protein